MPTISRARLARIEKILAADLDAARRVARLEKIATNEAEHPARRARAYDAIWRAWREAAMTKPSKAAEFWGRARLAAVKAEALRVKPSEIIAARLDALRNGNPFPDFVPDPDLRGDPDNSAARAIRARLDALRRAHLSSLN